MGVVPCNTIPARPAGESTVCDRMCIIISMYSTYKIWYATKIFIIESCINMGRKASHNNPYQNPPRQDRWSEVKKLGGYK